MNSPCLFAFGGEKSFFFAWNVLKHKVKQKTQEIQDFFQNCWIWYQEFESFEGEKPRKENAGGTCAGAVGFPAHAWGEFSKHRIEIAAILFS